MLVKIWSNCNYNRQNEMPLDISTLQPHRPFGKPPLLAHKHAHIHTHEHTHTHIDTRTHRYTHTQSFKCN